MLLSSINVGSAGDLKGDFNDGKEHDGTTVTSIKINEERLKNKTTSSISVSDEGFCLRE